MEAHLGCGGARVRPFAHPLSVNGTAPYSVVQHCFQNLNDEVQTVAAGDFTLRVEILFFWTKLLNHLRLPLILEKWQV